MNHLIVGHGEVGKAVHEVLGDALYYDPMDKNSTWHNQADVEVIHICIPYSEGFKDLINKGWKAYGALIIVHSTVPVGTCDDLGVVHSPIRGVHPHLAEGIRTFTKYFGGKRASEAARIFGGLGIKTRIVPEAKTTEAMKLWDTTQYGRLIMLEKEIHEWCVENMIDFDVVYTEANKDYNDGYIKLGRPDVVRPWLKHMDGPIGGHCVMPNSKLLGVKV